MNHGRFEDPIGPFLTRAAAAALAEAGMTKADLAAGRVLPVAVWLRCDPKVSLRMINRVITTSQENGYAVFVLLNASREEKGKNRPPQRITPPRAAAKTTEKGQSDNAKGQPPELEGATNTIVVSLLANSSGGIAAAGLGETPVQSLRELEDRIATAFKDKEHPFDRAIVQASANLRAEKLLRVLNMLTSQRLPNGEKFGMVELVEIPETE